MIILVGGSMVPEGLHFFKVAYAKAAKVQNVLVRVILHYAVRAKQEIVSREYIRNLPYLCLVPSFRIGHHSPGYYVLAGIALCLFGGYFSQENEVVYKGMIPGNIQDSALRRTYVVYFAVTYVSHKAASLMEAGKRKGCAHFLVCTVIYGIQKVVPGREGLPEGVCCKDRALVGCNV